MTDGRQVARIQEERGWDVETVFNQQRVVLRSTETYVQRFGERGV